MPSSKNITSVESDAFYFIDDAIPIWYSDLAYNKMTTTMSAFKGQQNQSIHIERKYFFVSCCYRRSTVTILLRLGYNELTYHESAVFLSVLEIMALYSKSPFTYISIYNIIFDGYIFFNSGTPAKRLIDEFKNFGFKILSVLSCSL